jgi:hypothetical protein
MQNSSQMPQQQQQPPQNNWPMHNMGGFNQSSNDGGFSQHQNNQPPQQHKTSGEFFIRYKKKLEINEKIDFFRLWQ